MPTCSRIRHQSFDARGLVAIVLALGCGRDSADDADERYSSRKKFEL